MLSQPSLPIWAVALGCLSLSHACRPPTVKISNGTVVGSTSGVIDTFLGIPFAQPPIGQLRFRPALALTTSFGVINATGTPRACPQLTGSNFDPHIISQVPAPDIAQYYPFFTPPIVAGEDCLSLNIQRPSSATAASKFPVLFWIYGGGFNTGSTQANDFANFVATSVSLEHPIIVVQANYRVSAFGFLGGSEVQAEGSTNIGLRDQRIALRWVAENIAAFGGDPGRVTIWGESAGAVSVLDHLLIEGGDNTHNGKPLFRAAIMNSGSSVPAEAVDSEVAQRIFDSIAEAGGCSESGRHDKPTSGRLECLRSLPYDDLINATNAVPALFSSAGVTMSFPPRPDPNDSFFSVSPEHAIRSKQISRVPIITGNQADEGTLFGLGVYHGTTSDALVDKHLRLLYPTTPRHLLKDMVDMYSADPVKGSPFGTGDSNQLYPGFKRNSALIGDTVFILQRRYHLEHTSHIVPSWSYFANYNQSAGTLGNGHGTDLIMFTSGFPVIANKHILQYYISFVNYLDPNRITKNGSRLTHWPKWTTDEKEMIQFDADGESTLRDDFRDGSYRYFKRIISQLKV